MFWPFGKQAIKNLVTNSDDVCKIIEHSARCGVSKLRLGDLEVTYGMPTVVTPLTHAGIQSSREAEISGDEHNRRIRAALMAEELKVRTDRLEQMVIENPSEAERQIMDGELDDADSDSGADDHDQ